MRKLPEPTAESAFRSVRISIRELLPPSRCLRIPRAGGGHASGDILYKVEDIEATGEDLSLLVSDHIRGEEGTKVHLTVYRQSTDEYVEMDVERRMVENPTVEYETAGIHMPDTFHFLPLRR